MQLFPPDIYYRLPAIPSLDSSAPFSVGDAARDFFANCQPDLESSFDSWLDLPDDDDSSFLEYLQTAIVSCTPNIPRGDVSTMILIVDALYSSPFPGRASTVRDADIEELLKTLRCFPHDAPLPKPRRWFWFF